MYGHVILPIGRVSKQQNIVHINFHIFSGLYCYCNPFI